MGVVETIVSDSMTLTVYCNVSKKSPIRQCHIYVKNHHLTPNPSGQSRYTISYPETTFLCLLFLFFLHRLRRSFNPTVENKTRHSPPSHPTGHENKQSYLKALHHMPWYHHLCVHKIQVATDSAGFSRGNPPHCDTAVQKQPHSCSNLGIALHFYYGQINIKTKWAVKLTRSLCLFQKVYAGNCFDV